MAISKAALERDAVAVDPKHYKVELENESMRIVRITYEAREKSIMHQHPPGIGVFITDAKFKFTYPDGKSENIESKAGQFMVFTEPWEHLPENLTNGHSEVVYIELKD